MFEISRLQIAVALFAAASAHALFAVGLKDVMPGAATPPAGPSVQVSGSLAGVLGSVQTARPVETEQAAPLAKPLEARTTGTARTARLHTARTQVLPRKVNAAAAATTSDRARPVQRREAASPSGVSSAEVTRAQEVAAEPASVAVTQPSPDAADQAPSRQIAALAPANTEAGVAMPRSKPRREEMNRRAERERAREARRRERLEARREAEREVKRKARRAAARASRAGSDRQGNAGERRGGQGRRSVASAGAMRSYGQRVRARVLSRRPSASGRRGTVVISFGLTGGGGLRYARIARSSGRRSLDRAALSAVRSASPFPRPPSGASAGQLRFAIPFSFR